MISKPQDFNRNQIYSQNKELKQTKAVTKRVLSQKVFLEISINSQENTSSRVSFLIKLQPEACNFI